MYVFEICDKNKLNTNKAYFLEYLKKQDKSYKKINIYKTRECE